MRSVALLNSVLKEPTVLSTEDTVNDLIDEAYALANGDKRKVELLEQAVAHADTLRDTELGYYAREQLVEAASFGGQAEKAITAFAWLRAAFDAAPEDFDEYSLLWQYKWILTSLYSFPTISRAQIEAALTDYADWLKRAGYGERPADYFRWKYAAHRGDVAASEALRQRWSKMAKSGMDDCPACEASYSVYYHARSGQDEQALKSAQPILAGRLRCAEVPHRTYASVLLPLLKLGRTEEATNYHQKGYKLIKQNPDFLEVMGFHLAFLAHTRKLPEAVKLFERHLPWALETLVPEEKFIFYEHLLPLFSRLRETGEETLALRLPKSFPLFNRSGHYAVDALEAHVTETLSELAQAFDARNGTDYFQRRISADEELLGAY